MMFERPRERVRSVWSRAWVGPSTGVVVALVVVVSMIGIPSAHATAGTELWATRTPWPDYSDVVASAVSPDGSRVFATGRIFVSSGDRFQTVAYDASGAEVWIRRYRQDGPFNNGAAAIGVGPNGSMVFVTGFTSNDTDVDYVTIAYDAATGTRVWKRQYTPPLTSSDVPAALGVSPDGSAVFVTGESSGGPTGKDYLTVAFSAATGRLLWAARYNLSFRDSARTLSVSPDSSAVFVSGYSVSDTSLDIETIAYDAATGEPLWESRYDGPRSREDQANAMTVSPDGSRVYIAGFSEGSNRARDIVTLAYRASTGALVWVRRYNGPADSNDNGKAIAVSPDGSRIFVTGYRTGHQDRDAETIAYSSVGKRLWLRAYNGPADDLDQATAIGVSPNGKQVFVAGFRTGAFFDRDYVTLAYRASSGDHLWEAFYDQDRATATALGVSPDGSAVYVSGVSGPDWATVAYSTS
jgi:PQQ-like domain/WD40-like Beta Propeller Repeat